MHSAFNETKICNYADDTTLFYCNKIFNDLMINLQHQQPSHGLKIINMKLNEEK